MVEAARSIHRRFVTLPLISRGRLPNEHQRRPSRERCDPRPRRILDGGRDDRRDEPCRRCGDQGQRYRDDRRPREHGDLRTDTRHQMDPSAVRLGDAREQRLRICARREGRSVLRPYRLDLRYAELAVRVANTAIANAINASWPRPRDRHGRCAHPGPRPSWAKTTGDPGALAGRSGRRTGVIPAMTRQVSRRRSAHNAHR